MGPDLRQQLEAEATACHSWSSEPGHRFAAHRHDYEKVLYCVRGTIVFTLEEKGEAIPLQPGDRLVLPPATLHSAEVGPEGVTCLEGWR